MLIDFLGYTAGILTMSSMFPQVIKNWKEKSAKDISLIRSIMWVIGVLIWIIYGTFIINFPLIIINTLNFILGSILLISNIVYGN
jgi:MtN3 and saliva related transmembrane protein